MQIGAETRGNILPTNEPKGLGFLGPEYNYDDELIRPASIGVKRNDTLGSVIDAVKGVGYYMDTIAFGQASSGLTADLPFKRLGTNYFINTGAKCSNGADMWHYMEQIPKGDAMGANISEAIKEMGLASLRGLAPGAIEDIKAATDLGPALKSLFGTGYPVCKLVNLPVGDESRLVFNYRNGKPWVDNLGAVKNCVPTGQGWVNISDYTFPSQGESLNTENFIRACQTKWVLDRMVTKKEWDAEKKIYNPDGTPANLSFKAESFTDFEGIPNKWLVIALLGITAANFWAYSRR